MLRYTYIVSLVECSKCLHTKEPLVFKGLTELYATLISFLKLVYNVLSEDSDILSISDVRFCGLWRRITG